MGLFIGLADEDLARFDLPAGKELPVDLGEVSVAQWRQVKREAGMRPVDVVNGFDTRDIDAVAAVVWFALRQAGADPGRFGDLEFQVLRVHARTEEEPSAGADAEDGELGKAPTSGEPATSTS